MTMTTKTILGRIIGDVYQTHDVNKAYKVLDEIRLQEGFYRAIKEVPVNMDVPLTNANYWLRVFVPDNVAYRGAFDQAQAYNKGDIIFIETAADVKHYEAKSAVAADTAFSTANFELKATAVKPNAATSTFTGEFTLVTAYVPGDIVSVTSATDLKLYEANKAIAANTAFSADNFTSLKETTFPAYVGAHNTTSTYKKGDYVAIVTAGTVSIRQAKRDLAAAAAVNSTNWQTKETLTVPPVDHYRGEFDKTKVYALGDITYVKSPTDIKYYRARRPTVANADFTLDSFELKETITLA